MGYFNIWLAKEDRLVSLWIGEFSSFACESFFQNEIG